MSSNEEEYKQWQERYESLKDEWDDEWDDERKRDHLENMQAANEMELLGREEARDEWGDEGDDNHDHRIEIVRNQDLLLKNAIAHADGEYDYHTESMRDVDPDLRRELERENDERWGYNSGLETRQEDDNGNEQQEEEEEVDMDIVSDSDDE